MNSKIIFGCSFKDLGFSEEEINKSLPYDIYTWLKDHIFYAGDKYFFGQLLDEWDSYKIDLTVRLDDLIYIQRTLIGELKEKLNVDFNGTFTLIGLTPENYGFYEDETYGGANNYGDWEAMGK